MTPTHPCGALVPAPGATPPTLAAAEDETRVAAILTALALTRGNITAAARALGLSRSALHRAIERHRLTPQLDALPRTGPGHRRPR